MTTQQKDLLSTLSRNKSWGALVIVLAWQYMQTNTNDVATVKASVVNIEQRLSRVEGAIQDIDKIKSDVGVMRNDIQWIKQALGGARGPLSHPAPDNR